MEKPLEIGEELKVIHADQVIFDNKKTLTKVIKEIMDDIKAERSETDEENV